MSVRLSLVLVLFCVLFLPARTDGNVQAGALSSQPAQLTPFGMDTYLASPDFTDGDVNTLSSRAQAIGVRWMRLELPWPPIHDDPAYWQPHYDQRFAKLAADGFGIIAILFTTPESHSTQACRDWADAHGTTRYLCPPANPQDFAAFAAAMAERYDGDGYQDAPGSPRIAYWEIWNEPDQPGTWLPAPDALAYKNLLCASYTAIKLADPTAGVLVGGLTDWDTIGLNNFLNKVVNYGGFPCFDVVSYHPFFLGHPPDEPVSWNVTHRALMVQDWIQDHGNSKQAWATEFGTSTCTSCTPHTPNCECNTEDEQLNYLVRSHAILLGSGFAHTDYYQLYQKLHGMPSPYAECELLRHVPPFTPKPAYTATGVMTSLLEGFHGAGPGVLHRVTDTWSDRYDYRFHFPSGKRVDVLWQIQGQKSYAFLLEPGVVTVYLYDRDGISQTLTPSGGYVTVTLSERPQYLVRTPTGAVLRTFLPLVPRGD